MTRLKAIDAFCGAGGLSIGLSRAGFEIILGFDIDPICIKTLKLNTAYFQHKVMRRDIRSLLNGKLLQAIKMNIGELDLLAGGPPCQGFSIQRTVGGDSDKRNTLVEAYGDLIIEVLPRYFLMENVPGIEGKRGGDMLEAFRSRISSRGYFIHKKTLNASDFGVPQRRHRVIFVGERLDGNEPKFRWPLPLDKPPRTVRDTIGGLPPPPKDGHDHPNFPGHRTDRLSEKNRQRLSVLHEGQGRTDLPVELLADCHLKSADKIGHRNVYGRMSWDEVAPTITARFDSFTRGKFGHPDQTRTISLYEGALLQTFPSDFKFVGTKVEIARQIGNAVPPLLAEAMGHAICDAMKIGSEDDL
jgi:DNA (cytosine-5)-methyltransferase 1